MRYSASPGNPPLGLPATAISAFYEDAPVFHTCSSVASLLTMVAQGIGVALMPEPIVRQMLDDQQLIELNIDQAAPALSFNCSWRLDDDRILPQLLANSSREIMTDGIQTA
ncbi:LysR substrate-binding domain-containing protein [Aliamphritea spongicola]|nr:LysR substrate-binding domain-containing protein [Aliamphritea spongicola]